MYIVIELQTNADGTVGTIVNDYASRPQAESKYHQILAAAALSAVPVHAAVILTNEGRMVSFQSYDHWTSELEAIYIVIELQTNADGTVGTIVNSYGSLPQAESKYHQILASAALSAVPVHAAVILTNEGRMVSFQSYDHRAPEPEAE